MYGINNKSLLSKKKKKNHQSEGTLLGYHSGADDNTEISLQLFLVLKAASDDTF